MEMMQMTWITPSSPALPKPKSFRCFRANLNLYKNEGEMVERVIILPGSYAALFSRSSCDNECSIREDPFRFAPYIWALPK